MNQQARPRSKKEPKYLEDITYTIASQGSGREEELFSSNLFMGRYDENQLMDMLDKVGMIAILHRKGYRNLLVSIHKQDDYTSRLYVNFDSPDKDTRLIEAIVREGIFRPKRNFIDSYDFSGGLSMLLIEWLALQDPKARFDPDKPRLPGQQYPGLGGLKNMQELLYGLGKSSGKDSIIDVPEFFHSAAIYSRLYSEIYSVKYSFFSPIDSGIMQAMLRDLKGKPLADISFAVSFDCLKDARTGKPAKWRTSEQIYPISKMLKRYVEDEAYKNLAIRAMNEHSFAIDWEKYDRLVKQGLMDEL
jgi:hypothetical protein